MVKLTPSSDNFIVYARNANGDGQITFYIPNMEVAVEAFELQPIDSQVTNFPQSHDQ